MCIMDPEPPPPPTKKKKHAYPVLVQFSVFRWWGQDSSIQFSITFYVRAPK